MKPKWQKLASLAQKICTLLFQFFGAVFASKGYPFKNILRFISRCVCSERGFFDVSVCQRTGQFFHTSA